VSSLEDNVHVRSFREFICERLPAALAGVVPLCDYRAEEMGDGVGRVTLRIGEQQVVFDDLPFPRPDGSFGESEARRTVVMTASSNDLEQAEIKAVGEQLMEEIGPRLVAPPGDMEWEEAALRAWFPLDRWLRDFVLERHPESQWLDTTNPIATATHLRRLRMIGPDVSFHQSHIGRVCPFDTPEGPNCGLVLTLAQGAEVRDGRIAPADGELGALSIAASLVPFLCHNDSNRQLMGVNMIRQWVPQEPAEAPLVQTGLEPEDGSANLGCNFLTAYLHWKGMTDEDAIVMSESAARRFSAPHALEVGDKLSNRHGTKGVVGAILPDDQMPHLPDGRAVELVFDSIAMHTRLNFGQVVEGLFGLIAEKRGEPVVASPFHRTSPEELHAALREAGLPESGQFRLRDGKGGRELDEPTTVGIVYWGKTVHLPKEKIHALGADHFVGEGSRPPFLGQAAGEMEYRALRAVGAEENIIDAYFTRSSARPDGEALARSVAGGFLPTRPAPPSAEFLRVERALRTAMIEMKLEGERVEFGWLAPGEGALELAEPVEHPWNTGAVLTHLGPQPTEGEAYQQAAAANERLAQALRAEVHPAAREAARASLRRAVQALFEGLGAPRHEEWPHGLRMDVGSCSVGFRARARFTGRTVLAPGYDLKLGQLGLPEEMAWTFFSPLIAGKGSEADIRARSAKARRVIETLMKESVVVLNRAPTLEPTSITAFTPVMVTGRSILLHPLCCRMFNADFDGDQAAVWLPVSRPAQEEAKAKLSLSGHLRRDPSVLVYHLTPSNSAMVGLAYAGECDEGRGELAGLWPKGCAQPSAPLTRGALVARLAEVMERAGPEELLSLLDGLYQMGIRWATRSGSSISPFVGEGLRLPPAPASAFTASWCAYASVVEAEIAAQADSDATLGALMRRIRSEARGSVRQLRALIGPWATADPYDREPPITHGFRDGLTAEEVWRWTARARAALQRVEAGQQQLAAAWRPAPGESVLRRAMWSPYPGQVFAEAAARGESDPLNDPEVRLWVGLSP